MHDACPTSSAPACIAHFKIRLHMPYTSPANIYSIQGRKNQGGWGAVATPTLKTGGQSPPGFQTVKWGGALLQSPADHSPDA